MARVRYDVIRWMIPFSNFVLPTITIQIKRIRVRITKEPALLLARSTFKPFKLVIMFRNKISTAHVSFVI